jgi:transcriptional regulator with XRE-family HTH domain
MNYQLGEYIKSRREDLGISQRGLAKKAGLSHSVVNKIELGDNPHPDTETLEKLADALKIHLSQLTDAIQGKTGEAKANDPLLFQIEALSPKKRKLVEDFVRLLLECKD